MLTKEEITRDRNAYFKELLSKIDTNPNTKNACPDMKEKYRRQLNELQNTSQEMCGCANCAQERMKKEMLQKDKAERDLATNLTLHKKIVKPYPSDFIPQLSPDYERFF